MTGVGGKPLPPIDAGSDIPNPVYVHPKAVRVPLPIAPHVVTAPSDGFDWADAVAGALGGALAVAAAGVATQGGRRIPAATA